MSRLAALVSLLVTGTAVAQGPDVTCLRVDDGPAYWGESGGTRAYSAATTSCNVGDTPAAVEAEPDPDHPVFVQNLYRFVDGRFEQVGLSWARHTFCSLNQSGCGTCVPTACDTLGIECADTNAAPTNGAAFALGPRSEIDPATGVHPGTHAMPSGPAVLAGRLQVADADVQPARNPGARYVWEVQYVAADDHLAGHAGNDAGWREVSFAHPDDPQMLGATTSQRAAIQAWATLDPEVQLTHVLVPDEGGPGVHGHFWVGCRVIELAGGTWRYEYAVQNLSSRRAAGAFTIPTGAGTDVTALGFHDVDHHSGEPWDGTDWTGEHTGAAASWSTASLATDPDANALRWGTLYSFRFVADRPPVAVTGTLGLFEPGLPAELAFTTCGPDPAGEPGTPGCFGDGTGAACPYINPGGPGEGCAHSGGVGMTLFGSGSASVAADDLVLRAEQCPPGNSGIFYGGKTSLAPGDPLYDGLQCAGGDVRRFRGVFQTTGTVTDTGFVAQDPSGVFFVPGTTVYFQYWSRDVAGGLGPCVTGANFSPSYAVQYVP